MSSGMVLEMPLGYTTGVSNPSGSNQILCASFVLNRLILLSKDGQYLGPFTVSRMWIL